MLPTVKYHERLNERSAAEARKRRHRALALRDKGKSWAEIALALGGLSRTRAKQLVELAAAERRAEDAEAAKEAAKAATAPEAAVTA